MSDALPLAGWVLVMSNGFRFIGKVSVAMTPVAVSRTRISPVYEINTTEMISPPQPGHPPIIAPVGLRVEPIFGCPGITSLDVPDGALVFPCELLDEKMRAGLAENIARVERAIKEGPVRVQLAGQMPKVRR